RPVASVVWAEIRVPDFAWAAARRGIAKAPAVRPADFSSWRRVSSLIARISFLGAPRPVGPQPHDDRRRALPHDAFGSRMSRSPSPIRLNASTAIMIATPGNTEIHGAVSR